jgi:hypothetical protein
VENGELAYVSGDGGGVGLRGGDRHRRVRRIRRFVQGGGEAGRAVGRGDAAPSGHSWAGQVP